MPQYSPGPVPQDVSGIPSFLNGEFERIADVLNGAVKLSFGGLFQAAPSVITPLGLVPVIFNPYDSQLPFGAEPQGTDPNLATGEITILTGGIYAITFASTGINIAVNAEYDFSATLNGVAGPAGGSVDPSNQTDRITMAFGGIVNYVRGDVIAVVASSPTSNAWESTNSQFLCFRISDSTD